MSTITLSCHLKFHVSTAPEVHHILFLFTLITRLRFFYPPVPLSFLSFFFLLVLLRVHGKLESVMKKTPTKLKSSDQSITCHLEDTVKNLGRQTPLGGERCPLKTKPHDAFSFFLYPRERGTCERRPHGIQRSCTRIEETTNAAPVRPQHCRTTKPSENAQITNENIIKTFRN